LIEAELLKAQKEYRGEQKKTYEEEVQSARQDMSNFTVSKDSIGGMSALGTGILMLGQLMGKTGGQQSAMGAIQAMTGMMEGYSKGRADEFKRNQIEFERNFKILQDKIKQANDKLQAALAEMPYNTIEAETKAKLALAELGSDTLTKTGDIQGLKIAADRTKEALTASLKLAEIARKQGVSSGKTGGALLAGRAENIREAFAQAAKDIVNVTRFPEGTMLGTFAGLTGADANTMLGGIRNGIARGVTDKEQRMLETLLSGIEGHMAFALGGGYASSQSKARMDQYKAQLARAGDDPVQVPLMLARFRQEMNILAENFASKPGATPEMNEAVQRYNSMINQAVPFTVEDVMDAEFGAAPKPSTAPAAKPVPTEADRERGRSSPQSRKNFINHFGVEP
jgi:hypothetical protein